MGFDEENHAANQTGNKAELTPEGEKVWRKMQD